MASESWLPIYTSGPKLSLLLHMCILYFLLELPTWLSDNQDTCHIVTTLQNFHTYQVWFGLKKKTDLSKFLFPPLYNGFVMRLNVKSPAQQVESYCFVVHSRTYFSCCGLFSMTFPPHNNVFVSYPTLLHLSSFHYVS